MLPATKTLQFVAPFHKTVCEAQAKISHSVKRFSVIKDGLILLLRIYFYLYKFCDFIIITASSS